MRKPCAGAPPLIQARSTGVANPSPNVLSMNAHRKMNPVARRSTARLRRPVVVVTMLFSAVRALGSSGAVRGVVLSRWAVAVMMPFLSMVVRQWWCVGGGGAPVFVLGDFSLPGRRGPP
jgi:hypothetical protein